MATLRTRKTEPRSLNLRKSQAFGCLSRLTTGDNSWLDVDAPVHVGHIALACCLGWLEFRELPGFRARRPRLSTWFDEFRRRPSMRATPLSGETHD